MMKKIIQKNFNSTNMEIRYDLLNTENKNEAKIIKKKENQKIDENNLSWN